MIIGLNGLKQSGKDTAGQYLVERHQFARLSFADPLKESAAACWRGVLARDWDRWKNDSSIFVEVKRRGNTIPFASLTAREFLQRFGTEAHRGIFGSDFWIDNVVRELDNFRRVVVTDVRFDNECVALKQEGAAIVRIERDKIIEGDTHASEATIPGELIDFVIANNGTRADLYGEIDQLVSLLEKEQT